MQRSEPAATSATPQRWIALFPSTITAHGGHLGIASTINPDDLD